MADMICERCGIVGRPRKQRPGHFAIELALWVLLCVPGLIYTIWRLAAPYLVSCRSCGGAVVALESPRGERLLDKYHPE